MFDILGIINLTLQKNLPSLQEGVFRNSPWDEDVGFERRTVSGRSFQVIYLERASGGDNYHAEDGKHLFIIGEVFPNTLWAQNTGKEARGQTTPWPPLLRGKGKRASRLSAQELFSSYCFNRTDVELKHQENGSPRLKSGDFLRYLKGNFSLIFIDEDGGECCLFNSRFGISPFYYAMDGLRFIFSTSLAAITKCLSSTPELDTAAVAELALFNYPLGDRTYFRNVKMLRPAEIIRADASGVNSETYWDVRTLYDLLQYSTRDALEIGAELFHKTVNNLTCDVPKVCVSFTSGFDSRAMLSVLEKEPSDYLCYSFGIPSSLNVTIPQQIARKVGFSYRPVMLDEAYESVFDDYAMQAVLLSDCLSTVERANYPYAFEQLADFSPVVLTGIFGSELMRTFQNVGHIVSAGLVRLNAAADPRAELRRMLAEPDVTRYFASDVLRRAADDVEADVDTVLIARFGEMPPDRRFYMFLLTEGLRKYFGAEVHMERLYGVNRFPFMDDEFVEFLFRAPFAGVHSRTLRPTVSNRYRSQYFYAYLIRKYKPDLLAAPTDHGYPPLDVLSPLALFIIGPKFLLARRKRRRSNYREFKTEEWTESLYKKILFRQPVNTECFTPAFESDFRSSGEWLQYRPEFARAASLKIWLEVFR